MQNGLALFRRLACGYNQNYMSCMFKMDSEAQSRGIVCEQELGEQTSVVITCTLKFTVMQVLAQSFLCSFLQNSSHKKHLAHQAHMVARSSTIRKTACG